MKIALYLRVSTEDQAKEGYSLEVRRDYLEFFAKHKWYEIFRKGTDTISQLTNPRLTN